MTLHARGYRRYEDGFHARRLRFGPIFVEGFREATRTRSFRRFTSLFVSLMLLYCVLYYVNPEALMSRFKGGFGGGPSRSELLRESVSQYLTALDWLSPLLVLFVGSGLVAEDLRTRALPLYLVRPITPVDYWLGKLLVPAGILGLALLLPTLTLVVFGILLEPADSFIPFAKEQGPLVLGVLAAYVAASAAYGSLALLLSTVTGRRTPALVLGTTSLYLSPVVVGFVTALKTRGGRLPLPETGGSLDYVRTLLLPSDVTAVFRSISGARISPGERWSIAPIGPAIGMIAALFVVTAVVVVRRARSVEVVS